jgi:N6-L-threonylcarbamoyladenine synthase
VVAGGVAANGAVREALAAVAARRGVPLVAPPPRLCTDNAVMVAWTGIERLRLGLADPLEHAPRPRWPLEGLAA